MDVALSAMPVFSMYPTHSVATDALASSPARRIDVPASVTESRSASDAAKATPLFRQTGDTSTASRPDTSHTQPTDGSDKVSASGEADATSRPSTSEQAAELEVQRVVMQLKSRDMEVRAHEQAHVAAGGQYVTSGASYSYQTGPDGKRYAVGGEVGIDTSPISGDPQATLAKAQQVQAAALAPAEPSSQDMRVAAQATQMASQARAEIAASQSPQTDATEDESETEGEDSRVQASARESSSVSRDTGASVITANTGPDVMNSGAVDRVSLDQNRDSGVKERMSSAASSAEMARNQFEIRLLAQAG